MNALASATKGLPLTVGGGGRLAWCEGRVLGGGSVSARVLERTARTASAASAVFRGILNDLGRIGHTETVRSGERKELELIDTVRRFCV